MKFWNWLVKSSSNPEKLALTVKGFLLGGITFVLYLAKLKGVDLAEGDLRLLVDNIGNLIVALGLVVSTAASVYGFGRKLVFTFAK